MANGFASVKPKHKHRIVTELQNLGHTVGMTGDGVNDAPALKVANVGIAVADATDAARGAADIVLTKEGLSTIVTAINRSRIIFRRLESYIVYRLASSCFILGFFVLSIMALRFDFPTWCLILLSIVNDLTVMATSKDNVRTSAYPLYWDIPRLCMLAVTIGSVCILQAFLLLNFLQQGSYNTNSSEIEWLSNIGLSGLEDCEIVAVMYLNMAISIQLNIFSARNKRFFFQCSEADDASPPPSMILCTPVIGAIILSIFLAVYWDEDVKLGGGNPMKGCGWGPAGATIVWCLVWFVIQEFVKVFANGLWDSTSNEGISDLFMSPMSRFFFSKKGRQGHVESESERVADSVKILEGADASRRRSSGGAQLSKAAAEAAGDVPKLHVAPIESYNETLPSILELANHDSSKLPTTLHSMAYLKENSSQKKELIATINAMRQHIVQLEQRVAQLDGINVHQTPHSKKIKN